MSSSREGFLRTVIVRVEAAIADSLDIAFGLGAYALINRGLRKVSREELILSAAQAGQILLKPEPQSDIELRYRLEGTVFMVMLVSHANGKPISFGKVLILASGDISKARQALIREMQKFKLLMGQK